MSVKSCLENLILCYKHIEVEGRLNPIETELLPYLESIAEVLE